ncbi:MAG: glycosyltransferase family 39 protein [Chloroflexi bacterium]|nr:glycosyltransferase family 39 protein [Chloroflexota bacterium]
MIRTKTLLRHNWPLLIVCLLAALLLLWRLGRGTLRDWDEAIFAQISKEMVQSGNWLVPYWGYELRFHKPPLFYWTTAIFFRLFGVSEFWARAASAFSGVGLVALTYLVGKRAYDRWTGFLAAVILLTSYQFIFSARFGTSDVMLTLWIYVAVYAYFRLRDGHNHNWWYVAGAAFGLAFMVKSAGALVAPATIGLALLLDRRITATLKTREFWLAGLLAVIIVLPWHAFMVLRYGQAFLGEYVGRHIVARATTVLAGHVGSIFYYLGMLYNRFFPWFYLLPFALVLAVRENMAGEKRSRFLLVLMATVFFVYTAAQTKLSWYIFPLYPALAVLTASFVVQPFRICSAWRMVAPFAARRMNAPYAAMRPTSGVSSPVLLVLPFAGLVLLVVIPALLRRRSSLSLALAAVLGVFFLVAGLYSIRPLYQKMALPAARLAYTARSADPTDREVLVLYSGVAEPSVLFYSDRPIRQAAHLEKLDLLTSAGRPVRIIFARKDMNTLAAAYSLEVQAEAGQLVYGLIQRRADVE